MAALLALGCPIVDLGDDPPVPGRCLPNFAEFRDNVWPMYVAPANMSKSCVDATGCHARSTGRSALRLIPSPVDDIEHRQNYNVVTPFLNCNTPSASVFITRPLDALDPHGGGDIWLCTNNTGPDCDLVTAIETWIAQQ